LPTDLHKKPTHEQTETPEKPDPKIDQPPTLTNASCRSKTDSERILVAGKVKEDNFSSQTILPKTLKREKSPGV
jgi:hypothetical protein